MLAGGNRKLQFDVRIVDSQPEEAAAAAAAAAGADYIL